MDRTQPADKRKVIFHRALSGALILFIALFLNGGFSRTRAWETAEVPIAFWAWRNHSPEQNNLNHVREMTGTRALFLHAGQFDFEQGKSHRIRAVVGPLPSLPELHLTYNTTRSFLKNFEQMPPALLSATIVETFLSDCHRAAQDAVTVTGLQLDFDIPTRLLPQYTQLLQLLRQKLSADFRLSITGLPTWVNSREITPLLVAVDFWIPQLYGMQVPENLYQPRPIASLSEISRLLPRIRQLGKPFYAGLSAYSYLVLYSAEGRLLELRGDTDPTLILNHPDLELIERKPFAANAAGNNPESAASEWRFVWRVIRDFAVDGLTARSGNYLMLDLSTSEMLRASARLVRKEAGETLLGICLFRLPSAEDATTLTLTEMVSALNDQSPQPVMQMAATLRAPATAAHNQFHQELEITARNIGTAAALPGKEALTIEFLIPAAGIRAIRLRDGLETLEPRCRQLSVKSGAAHESQPCSERLANVLRLTTTHWQPGQQLRLVLDITSTDALVELPAQYTMQLTDGRRWNEQQCLLLKKEQLP